MSWGSLDDVPLCEGNFVSEVSSLLRPPSE